MNSLENKYIDLLLKRCINFDRSKSLFISFDKGDKKSCDFVDMLVISAKEMVIEDINLFDDA